MSNHIQVKTLGSATYELAGAILLYNRGHDDTYATFHNIERRRRGGPQLEPGVPATIDACAQFARAIAERAAFSGFLSPQILYVGPRVAAWWRPPAPARVWFECAPQDDKAKDIGTRNAIVPHPGLVFVVVNGRWYVHAVKGTERPGPQTPLYVAPYFNVSGSGWICEGNLKRPDRVTPESIADFERAFFESRFTHPNIHKGSDFAKFKGGPYAFWKAILDHADAGGIPIFPQHLMVSAKTTLAAHIKQLEDRKHD